MADVAQLAGVSHQTVSRVLNEHPNVRPDTREKVLAAIRQLAYRPNAAARALVTRRTHTLGVISTDSTLYGPAMMLDGIERAAQHGYFVLIASLPALDRRSVTDTVDRFLGHAVEGMIVIAPQTSAVAALSHVPPEVPLVAMGCGTRAPLTSVAVDNAGGAHTATEFLLGLGHETVYHVAGPSNCLDARERTDGWRAALREAGAREPGVIVGDWSSRSGYETGQKLARMADVTAVFCSNDTIALGLIRALTEAGRRVPEDVSVVGFDDTPESAYFLPPLTTIRQPKHRLGIAAMETMTSLLRGEKVQSKRLPAELIERKSSAPPKV